MKARQVLYKGRVQGVGFRYQVKQIAMGYDVAGNVRNLPDGRVELVAAAERDELESFLTAIRESGLSGLITGEEGHEIAAPADLRGFEIRS